MRPAKQEGVAAVSWIESLMIRRPLGSIDPNSIRETELHTESRSRHSRGEREFLHSPQLHRERDYFNLFVFSNTAADTAR